MISKNEMVLDNPNFVPRSASTTSEQPKQEHAPRPRLFNTSSDGNFARGSPFESVGLFFLSSFLFFLFSRVLDFKLSGLHLPLILSTICLLIALATGTNRSFRLNIMKLLTLFTLWFLICIPFSVWKGGSVELFKDVWSKSYMAGFIVAALVTTSHGALRIAKVTSWAFLAAAMLGLVVGESQDGRLMLAEGSYSNPNDYDVAILYGCVCWYFMFHNPRNSMFMRIFSLAVIGFLFLMLLKTGSRGALITATITFGAAFLRYRAMTKIFILLAAPILLIGSLLMLPAEIRNRYMTFFSDDSIQKAQSEQEREMLLQAQGSSQQRLQLLKDAAWLTVTNPIVGVGPGMFSVAQNDMSIEKGMNKGAWLGTHNTYLEVASEMGLPGLIIFLACLLTCWRDLKHLETATANRRDLRAQEVQTLAFTLRLLMISSCVFFFFEHIPFSPFVPVLTCWIAAFSAAAREELQIQIALAGADSRTSTPLTRPFVPLPAR